MRRLLAGLVMLAVVACGGSDSGTGPTATSVVGNWTLSTVNGTALPYLLIGSGANKSELTSGSLTVSSTSYTITFGLRTTANGVVSTSSSADAGTVAITGTAITLRSTVDGTTITGGASGNTLTLSESGGVYVFTR